MRSEAHLFLIKAPASPSPGESGELQRQGETWGTGREVLPRWNLSFSDLERNLSSPGQGAVLGWGAWTGQFPTVSCPSGSGSMVEHVVEFSHRQIC